MPENGQELHAEGTTILVVDDDPGVLRFVGTLLGHGGRNILNASSAADALVISQDHHGVIDLLLSDIEMPGMTGVGLATEVTRQRPKIKVLLMSGFPGGMLILNEGWHFLPKPFIASQLRSLVDEIISPAMKSGFAEKLIA